MLKYLWRRYGPNPFDQLLKRAKEQDKKRFLICWNRGLGDIPLGLYALNERIRTFVPDAIITYATRSDLSLGFKMLAGISLLVDPEWKRGIPFNLDATLEKMHQDRSNFDVIIEHPNPSRWLLWQLGRLTPRLSWDPEWDSLSTRFGLSKDKTYIGVHVQTETNYAYEKNWPLDHWRALFRRIFSESDMEIVLFGFGCSPRFDDVKIHDMRGKTSLFEMLSIIKNHCRFLVVPDSGVLSMVYYIDVLFPIDIVSLWADPRQGILKQNVPSPNLQLKHRPLIADGGQLSTLSVDTVMEALFHQVRSLC
jgi:ADP-heptose:LPS heptosyltransferase